jgi:hypothetical protein
MAYQPPLDPLENQQTDPILPTPEPLGDPPRRWNWRVMVIIFAIIIPLFVGIYLAWQAYTPPDPSGLINPQHAQATLRVRA